MGCLLRAAKPSQGEELEPGSGQCPWDPSQHPKSVHGSCSRAGLGAPAASQHPSGKGVQAQTPVLGCGACPAQGKRNSILGPLLEAAGGRDWDGSAPGAALCQVRCSDGGCPTPCSSPSGKTPQAILFLRKVHRRGAAQYLPGVSIWLNIKPFNQRAFLPFGDDQNLDPSAQSGRAVSWAGEVSRV